MNNHHIEKQIKNLIPIVQSFVNDLKYFDYTIWSNDKSWKFWFKSKSHHWEYFQITKYNKTFSINHINGETGTLEYHSNKITFKAPNDFEATPYHFLEKEEIKQWQELILAAKKWQAKVRKNWLKANIETQEELPLKYRFGTISQSVLFELQPNPKNLTKNLGKINARKFIDLVEQDYFINPQNFKIKSFTANQYFEYCKIAYMATVAKKRKLSSTLSGRELYQQFADGRHEGLLDINPNSTKEFSEWLDGKHPKRKRGGHPWEIVRGGSFTHIGLRVQRPSFHDKDFYTLELYGNATTQLADTIKMFLALYKYNLPVTIAQPENIRKRLLLKDNIGIIPEFVSPSQAEEYFFLEEDVFDTMYLEDFRKLKKRFIPFIFWKKNPILRKRK